MKSCLGALLLSLHLHSSVSAPSPPIEEQKIRVDGVDEDIGSHGGEQGPVELKWGPLNVLSTTEKVGICERVLESDENHSLPRCIATAHAVVLRHRPLLGLLTGQLQEVCEHLRQYLARVSTLAKSNKGTTAKVCEEISDDESKAEEDGQEATCAAVQRLLSKGVTLDSVCNRLSLPKTCLDDLKKSSHLRGRKACELGLSDNTLSRDTPAHHFLHVCAATVSKIHSLSLIHTLTTAQTNNLLFFNAGDNAVTTECSKQLSDTDGAVSICWDMVASFVESRSAHSSSTPAAHKEGPFDIPAFCRQYAAWLIEEKNTESKQDTAEEKTAIMTSSVRAAPIKPIKVEAAPSTVPTSIGGRAQLPTTAGGPQQQMAQHFPGMPQIPLQVPQAAVPVPQVPPLPDIPLHIPQVPVPPQIPPAPHTEAAAAAAGHVPSPAIAPVVPQAAAAAPSTSTVPGGVPQAAGSPGVPKAVPSVPQVVPVLPQAQAGETHAAAPPTAAVQGTQAPAVPQGTAVLQPVPLTPPQNTTSSAVLVTNGGQKQQSGGGSGQQQQPSAVVSPLTPPQNTTTSAVIVASNTTSTSTSAKAKDDKDDVDDVDSTKSENVDIKVVEAKLKVAKENADMMIKSEHLAKVVADKITEKAVTMKHDAEAIENTEKVAKKEADIIAKNAAIAKAAADAISKKAHDAQVDAQKIAEKASEANKDAIKIEIKAIDAKRDATVIMQKAQIADKNAAKVAKKATEAATKASKWENKVTQVKTDRVKKEYIPMSSWA